MPTMNSAWARTAAVGVSALLLTAAYKRAEPSSVMADAANAFLNSLWPDQKAKEPPEEVSPVVARLCHRRVRVTTRA